MIWETNVGEDGTVKDDNLLLIIMLYLKFEWKCRACKKMLRVFSNSDGSFILTFVGREKQCATLSGNYSTIYST